MKLTAYEQFYSSMCFQCFNVMQWLQSVQVLSTFQHGFWSMDSLNCGHFNTVTFALSLIFWEFKTKVVLMLMWLPIGVIEILRHIGWTKLYKPQSLLAQMFCTVSFLHSNFHEDTGFNCMLVRLFSESPAWDACQKAILICLLVTDDWQLSCSWTIAWHTSTNPQLRISCYKS